MLNDQSKSLLENCLPNHIVWAWLISNNIQLFMFLIFRTKIYGKISQFVELTNMSKLLAIDENMTCADNAQYH